MRRVEVVAFRAAVSAWPSSSLLGRVPAIGELIRWPFLRPERLLDRLGYTHTVEALNSPTMRAHAATSRCLGRLAGDELAFTDGVHSGAGQLAHWPQLNCLHRAPIYSWLVEHWVDLSGTSESCWLSVFGISALTSTWRRDHDAPETDW